MVVTTPVPGSTPPSICLTMMFPKHNLPTSFWGPHDVSASTAQRGSSALRHASRAHAKLSPIAAYCQIQGHDPALSSLEALSDLRIS